MEAKSDILAAVCALLSADAPERAQQTLREHYPLSGVTVTQRKYKAFDLVCTAMRDGFIDRYSGARLVYPGTLRLLSILLPTELPHHANWAYDRCHPMYWDLYPRLDHVVPVARGGLHVEQNWVTTSQRMNSAKAHWLLEEIGWSMRAAGDVREWDGLMGWFLQFVELHPGLCADSKILRKWRDVAVRAAATRACHPFEAR